MVASPTSQHRLRLGPKEEKQKQKERIIRSRESIKARSASFEGLLVPAPEKRAFVGPFLRALEGPSHH